MASQVPDAQTPRRSQCHQSICCPCPSSHGQNRFSCLDDLICRSALFPSPSVGVTRQSSGQRCYTKVFDGSCFASAPVSEGLSSQQRFNFFSPSKQTQNTPRSVTFGRHWSQRLASGRPSRPASRLQTTRAGICAPLPLAARCPHSASATLLRLD